MEMQEIGLRIESLAEMVIGHAELRASVDGRSHYCRADDES
jgi:hypothetical protein